MPSLTESAPAWPGRHHRRRRYRRRLRLAAVFPWRARLLPPSIFLRCLSTRGTPRGHPSARAAAALRPVTWVVPVGEKKTDEPHQPQQHQSPNHTAVYEQSQQKSTATFTAYTRSRERERERRRKERHQHTLAVPKQVAHHEELPPSSLRPLWRKECDCRSSESHCLPS